MKDLDRISFNPKIMGGKPIVRGMRVTVGMIVGLVESGVSKEQILIEYPYLEEEDVHQALEYTARHGRERETPNDLD